MRGLFAAFSAELINLYLVFLFFPTGKMVVLVFAHCAAQCNVYSICHNFSYSVLYRRHF